MKQHTGLFDKVGITASSLCIVHCIGTIILALLLPATWLASFANESVHGILAIVVLGAGLFAFIPGYRIHKKKMIIITATFGLALIIATQVIPESYMSENLEIGLTFFGGGMLMFTHWKNRKYFKACFKKTLSCASSCADCFKK